MEKKKSKWNARIIENRKTPKSKFIYTKDINQNEVERKSSFEILIYEQQRSRNELSPRKAGDI